MLDQLRQNPYLEPLLRLSQKCVLAFLKQPFPDLHPVLLGYARVFELISALSFQHRLQVSEELVGLPRPLGLLMLKVDAPD